MKKHIAILTILALTCFSVYLLATTTNYTQAFDSGHGWTYVEVSCGGTCSNGDVSGDGNPADSVFSKVTGRNKGQIGYWKLSASWETLGVDAGDNIDTVDGQWDTKIISTAVACTADSLAGVLVYDSADTTECTASTVEPLLDVSGDASWTNHNPTGAIAVNVGCQPSTTTVSLRAHSGPDCGNDASAECELRYDNFKLAIVHTTPVSGVRRRTVVTWNRGSDGRLRRSPQGIVIGGG